MTQHDANREIDMSTDGRTAILSYLRENAARYFTEFNHAELDIRFVGEQKGLQASIYRFELREKGKVRFLRVKVPLHANGIKNGNNNGQKLSPRPRRFPAAELETKFQLEYAALSAIHSHFDSLHDPRFGAVQMLDSLPGIRANVMEEVPDSNLRQLFARENRLHLLFSSARCDTAFGNAGAWLRAYHSFPKQAADRHTQRVEFIESITAITDYLANRIGGRQFFANAAAVATEVALEALPESLPVGLGHGDYAMRNVLVGSQGRVTVLDTLARWRTAVYEDIGYFLTNLKMTWPQVISQGLVFKPDLIAQHEHQFLVGYFGSSPVPLLEIRLYEIQALLDKWSGRVARLDQHVPGRQAAVKRLQHALENRHFKRSLSALMKAVG